MSRTSVRNQTNRIFVAAFAAVVVWVSPLPARAVGIDKQVKDVCRTSKDADFRAKYCAAAKDQKKGYVANITTSAVWTGVTTVCAAACGKAVGGLACKISSSGGTVGEGILTKKFVNSILGEGASRGSELVKGGAETDKAAPAKGGVDASACTTAGTSALKAYEKYSSSKQNMEGLSQLREQTKGMNTQPGTQPVNFGGDTQITTGDRDGTNRLAATTTATKEVCDEGALSNALGSIRCAAHADPSLPAYVKSEDFLRDLQKATGQSPDVFFGNFESPAKSLFDSPAVKGLSESQQSGLAQSLEAMDAYSVRKVAAVDKSSGKSGGEYQAGGRGNIGDSMGANDDLDINGVLAGVLGQLGVDGKPIEESPTRVDSIAAADRQPASSVSPENRAISIFDRVKWRYGALSRSDRIGGLAP